MGAEFGVWVEMNHYPDQAVGANETQISGVAPSIARGGDGERCYYGAGDVVDHGIEEFTRAVCLSG